MLLLACAAPSPGAPEDPWFQVDLDEGTVPFGLDSASTAAAGTTPPTLRVALADAPRARVDPLHCAVESDLAEPSWSLSWTVDGEPWEGPRQDGALAGDTIFPGYLEPGAVWTCTATDGHDRATASTTVADFDPGSLDPWIEPSLSWADGQLRWRGAPGALSVQVRYGFDGWSAREAPAGATLQQTDEGDEEWGLDANMAWEGEWALPLTPPEGVRAIHARFVADGAPDDNGGRDWTWDLEFPSVGPYLSWNDAAPPASGIVVSWETGQPGLGLVEYGPDEEHTAWAVGAAADTLHQVALNGLTPDSSYVYRVHDSTGRASPWAGFRTADPEAEDYLFLVASDMQDDGQEGSRWAEVAAEMAAKWPDAAFVLAPGDLAANDQPGWWWLFFEGGRGLFDHVPIVPALGNHDTPGVASNSDHSSYLRWFALPGGESWYRLDYGRTRIYAVDSEILAELHEGGAQFDWIDAERLAPDDEVDWTLALFHHSPYDVGARFAYQAPSYRPLTELFDGFVDLSITGHEHIYQRFAPIRYPRQLAPSGRYGLGEEDGVAYVVTPAAGYHTLKVDVVTADEAGGDQLPLLAYPPLEAGQDAVQGIHGYLVGEVGPRELELRFMGMGGEELPTAGIVLDTLEIER